MANSNLQVLLVAAELLEKTAEYHNAVVTTQQREKEVAKKKIASDLATQISDMVGEQVDEDTVSKLAESSPEVQGLINKLANLSTDTVDSLGDVHTETKKHASDDGVTPEDAAFFEAICND